MKKVLMSIFAAGLISGLSADGFEIEGIISNIDQNAKTILVNDFVVQVMPQTQIKLDDCGIFGTDKSGKFVDLAVGSFVEIEAWPSSSVDGANTKASYIASEIEQKCVSNKAY